LVGLILLGLAAAGFAASVRSERVANEGRRFGAAVDDAACLAEARARPPPVFLAARASFIAGCLDAARPTEAFCAGVARVSLAEYRNPLGRSPFVRERCAREPEDDDCEVFLEIVQDYCSLRLRP
jgi:hypothetical protein